MKVTTICGAGEGPGVLPRRQLARLWRLRLPGGVVIRGRGREDAEGEGSWDGALSLPALVSPLPL